MTYRITNALGGIDNSVSPPAIVTLVFPAFDGTWRVISSSSEVIVEAPDGVTPTDLGPLVKVEAIG